MQLKNGRNNGVLGIILPGVPFRYSISRLGSSKLNQFLYGLILFGGPEHSIKLLLAGFTQVTLISLLCVEDGKGCSA